jgi:metal-responsive CopG/Arc/MetJ family transcriptional regulator
MAIVNFSIPAKLAERVNKQIKQKGFAGKAEFFRMAAMFFLESSDSDLSDKKRMNLLVSAIKDEVVTKYGKKKILSVRKQLANL